jgi:hypothetical protein
MRVGGCGGGENRFEIAWVRRLTKKMTKKS